jgi:hypothetical protein
MSAMISLNVLTPTRVMPEARSFMVDSGATIHLVNDLSLLPSPTLHRSPIPLHMATSDATGQIIATGSLCLSSAEQQPLWLHNVHCVPSATANLISVTAAIRDRQCGKLHWDECAKLVLFSCTEKWSVFPAEGQSSQKPCPCVC